MQQIAYIVRYRRAEHVVERIREGRLGLALKQHHRKAVECELARQGDYEGGDLHVGDPEALPRADQYAQQQAHQHAEPHRHAPVDYELGGHGADKAHHAADAQVYVGAGHDTQKHTGGQYDYVGVLVDDVVDVGGSQVGVAGGHEEEQGYHHQGDKHHALVGLLANLLEQFRPEPAQEAQHGDHQRQACQPEHVVPVAL